MISRAPTAPCRAHALAVALSLLVTAAAAAPASALEQVDHAPVATVEGEVSALERTVRLPGVSIAVLDERGIEVAVTVSDGAGEFRLDLPAGLYQVRATLEGFSGAQAAVTLVAGEAVPLSIDLRLAGVVETVVVRRPSSGPGSSEASLGATAFVPPELVDELPLFDDSVASVVTLLPGVVRGPKGINIKGGRPTASSVQLGGAYVTDPSTGTSPFSVPGGAVASIEVLPNPYAVEFGRFSSGVTVIETKKGGDRWRFALTNPIPAFQTSRANPVKVTGIRGFGPSLVVGGPLIRDRLFLAHTSRYRYSRQEVWSRPQEEQRETQSLNAFTRLDLNLGQGHLVTGTVGIFPERRDAQNLDTFNPPEVTVDTRRDIYDVGLSASTLLSRSMVLEGLVHVGSSSDRSGGRDLSGMTLLPDGNAGSFFNRSTRDTSTYQGLVTLNAFREAAGQHQIKLGVDVLHASYTGTSASGRIDVRRLDGSLAERLEYDNSATSQRLASTDLAVFAQDRWRPNDRLLVEFGARLDRNGVLGRTDFTPRVGAVVSLDEKGDRRLQGGIGLFYERTPLAAGAFEQFESPTVSLFAPDGTTLLGSPTRFAHRLASNLRTPRGLTWHVEYDHRLGPRTSARAHHLRRDGAHQLLVEPLGAGADAELLLSSRGRDRYHETEVGVRHATNGGATLDVAYTYARSTADLNAFSAYFGPVWNPIIRANEFGVTSYNVPHRLVARTNLEFGRWHLLPILEVRSGFPFSALDDTQQFVGARNQAGRFPAMVRLDVAVERQVSLLKWQPWVGVRILNALGRFNPIDVQRNVASPQYGQFFNANPREFRVTIRIGR